jgi:cyclophilin family peptidyl-prolyl cis-trans isomerase
MDSQKGLIVILILAVVAAAGYFTRDLWLPAREGTPTVETQQDESRFMTKIEKGTLCTDADLAKVTDPENTLLMEVSTGGCVVIVTFPDKAPHHVARFKELAREDFYDNIVFHRVIEGFMAQTGDPTGTGSGGSGVGIVAEFNDVPHTPGIVSTARSDDPNSADSQFFIMYGTKPHLDGQYTVWGKVVSGMEFIQGLKKGPVEENGIVQGARDYIVSLRVASDVMADKGN